MNPTDTIDDRARAPGVSDDPPTRQCGRCRHRFPVDADIDPIVLTDWWACPNCLDMLLPRRRTATTHVEHHEGPT